MSICFLVFVRTVEDWSYAVVGFVRIGGGCTRTGPVCRGGNVLMLVVGIDCLGRDEKRGPA